MNESLGYIALIAHFGPLVKKEECTSDLDFLKKFVMLVKEKGCAAAIGNRHVGTTITNFTNFIDQVVPSDIRLCCIWFKSLRGEEHDFLMIYDHDRMEEVIREVQNANISAPEFVFLNSGELFALIDEIRGVTGRKALLPPQMLN